MLKALNLPKGAKDELNYPLELVEKIQRGDALWNEDGEAAGDEDDPDAKKLTDVEKLLMEMFGKGKYHLIPSKASSISITNTNVLAANSIVRSKRLTRNTIVMENKCF